MERIGVSVCIPTYNGSRYIAQCLESVLNQSYSNIEIVIVDDQSTDSTWSILEEYAANDHRIRLFRNERNLGLVGNWNRCLELVNGDWIKFAFQDDYLARECVEKMVIACEDSDSVFGVCQRDYVYEDVSESIVKAYERAKDATDVRINRPEMRKFSAKDFCKILSKNPTENFLGEPTSMIFHRNVVDKLGVFNPDLIQVCDLEYWARVASNEGFVFVPEVLAFFRVHGESTSLSNESSKAYAKNVIDPIKLMCEYAHDIHFEFFRRVASENDIDIRRIFRRFLLNAQIAAYYDPEGGRGKMFNEWRNVSSRYSFVKVSSVFPGFLVVWWKRFQRKVLYVLGVF